MIRGRVPYGYWGCERPNTMWYMFDGKFYKFADVKVEAGALFGKCVEVGEEFNGMYIYCNLHRHERIGKFAWLYSDGFQFESNGYSSAILVKEAF